jgi:hypothetical protein
MKPKFKLNSNDDNYRLILRAGSILSNHGFKKEAKDIHKEASMDGYDFYKVLKLLKKYMELL